MLEEIRKTRERLHKQLKLKSINSKEVLEISRELDKLILEYYRSKEISFDEENDG